jgi:hypothetical protein
MSAMTPISVGLEGIRATAVGAMPGETGDLTPTPIADDGSTLPGSAPPPRTTLRLTRSISSQESAAPAQAAAPPPPPPPGTMRLDRQISLISGSQDFAEAVDSIIATSAPNSLQHNFATAFRAHVLQAPPVFDAAGIQVRFAHR